MSRRPSRDFPKNEGWHWDQVDAVVRPDGKIACRLCKEAVEAPRRSFCSKSCSDQWSLRLAGQNGCREICRKRDKGVCQSCGLDTKAIEREFEEASVAARLTYLRDNLGDWADRPDGSLVARTKKIKFSRAYRALHRQFPGDEYFWATYGRRIGMALRQGRALFEADHVIEIADGGDHFDPSNLVSLCLDCHKSKSAVSTRTRAVVKRKSSSVGR